MNHVRLRAAVTETLEARRLLAAPEVLPLPISNEALEARALYVPVRTTDADGDDVTLSVELTGDNADDAFVELLPRDNTFLRMNVDGFGEMTFQLYDDIAPETARRISGLADAGYYDGLSIFRVINDFVLQFGDPTENGQNSDPIRPRVEYSFDDEFDPDFLFTGDGQLAMANSGKDTNSSQFFITEGPQRQLDGNFTLFGQLIRGFDVRDTISDLPTGASDRPTNVPTVSSVEVFQSETDAVFRLVPGNDTAGQTFSVQVTASDVNNESSTRTFTFDTVADDTNSPAVLLPLDDNRVTDAGEAIVINALAADPEGDDIDYAASFTNFERGSAPVLTQAGVGTLVVDNTTGNVTFTPEGGFTGPAEFFVYARDIFDTDNNDTTADAPRTIRGNTSFPYDVQRVVVGVGDEGATGQGQTVRALRGVELADVVVATFTDSDVGGTFDDWTAQIDWGDGVVDGEAGDATDEDVVVRAGSTPGTFEVVGSHTYSDTAEGLPVTVTITGDLGAELVVISQADVRLAATYDGSNGQISVNGTSGDDDINISINGGNVRVSVNGSIVDRAVGDVGILEITGGDGNDTIVLASDVPAARVFAGAGDDTVTTGLANDEIFGGDGDDVLDGSGGNDSIVGDAGDDYLLGGTDIDYEDATLAAGYFDRDTLIGGEGNDTLTGGLDQNDLRGGPGNDLLNGSGSRDSLDGGEGNDLLRGYGNTDLLIGGDGADTLLGDAESGPRGGAANGGADTLEGGNGDDVLRGFFGNDLFRGGAGNDAIFGGDGDDTDEDREAGDTIDSVENES